ncbi:MAG: hypothetical protein H6993_07405 [Pseudomonadales bacterium]|nr:hypothetical protein [Pseudomonadales bacterium]MCP5183772.1 hypothetical protein [Pseudomonadales bacterium]
MMEKTTRVLYMLDCGSLDVEALRLVAPLSGDGNVELTGLYIEDEDLLNAMQIPGLTEVKLLGQGVATVNPSRLRDELHAHARALRESFETSANRLNVRHVFHQMQGRVVEVMVREAGASDLVVVSRPLRSVGLRARRALQFQPLVRAKGNVLFVNEPWSSGTSIVALCESETGACGRALITARRIADAEGIHLIAAVRTPIKPAGVDKVIHVTDWTEDGIARLCAAEDARLLVMSEFESLDWQSLLLALSDRLPCSLLRLDT